MLGWQLTPGGLMNLMTLTNQIGPLVYIHGPLEFKVGGPRGPLLAQVKKLNSEPYHHIWRSSLYRYYEPSWF